MKTLVLGAVLSLVLGSQALADGQASPPIRESGSFLAFVTIRDGIVCLEKAGFPYKVPEGDWDANGKIQRCMGRIDGMSDIIWDVFTGDTVRGIGLFSTELGAVVRVITACKMGDIDACASPGNDPDWAQRNMDQLSNILERWRCSTYTTVHGCWGPDHYCNCPE